MAARSMPAKATEWRSLKGIAEGVPPPQILAVVDGAVSVRAVKTSVITGDKVGPAVVQTGGYAVFKDWHLGDWPGFSPGRIA